MVSPLISRHDSAISHNYIPSLDGVRGIAICAVLAVHTFANMFPGSALGALGVDLFFVLSGFLITGTLLDSKHSPTYFRDFYAKRILRLFPVAYLYLLVTAFLFPTLHRMLGTSMPDYAGDWWWYLAYVPNLKPGQGAGDPYLWHFWSLAVEEQFYMFWPFLVLLLPTRWLFRSCLAMVAASLFFRIYWVGSGESIQLVYRNTFARVDAMAIGAAVLLVQRQYQKLLPAVRSISIVAAALFLVTLPILGVSEKSPWMRTGGQTLAGLAFGGLILYATENRYNWLSWRPLRQMGKYSYCLYVIHVAVIAHMEWVQAFLTRKGVPGMQWVAVLASMPLCYGIAALSWSWLEAPILKLKSRFQGQRSAEDRVAVSAEPAAG
ncbi:MAG: acyltransferase [Bryobacteraceae bacterium]|nr:acyltransferase [Bryobacteraceae bacterium]